jgi:hypothetical protein
MNDPLKDFHFVKAYKPVLRLPLGNKSVPGGVAGTPTMWVLCVLLDRDSEKNWPASYSAIGDDAGGLSVSVVKRAIREGVLRCIGKGHGQWGAF